MACYFPLQAFYGPLNRSGKRSIVFNANDSAFVNPITLPCGRCIGCRLERSRQWAVRCMHEAKLYDDNCFLTLTYNNAYLPSDSSLDIRHFQLFMKRLRKKFGNGIRFFHCGEYGGQTRRPHYHAIVFNFNFVDRKYHKMSKSGHRVDISRTCDEIWGLGDCYVGNVSFESAAYVARYVVDKYVGHESFYHYLDVETGVLLKPEYVSMSRRPGIGSKWLDMNMSDVYPSDEVIVRGKECKPPKFYDNRLEVVNPDMYDDLKHDRRMCALERAGDNTPERLDVREKVKRAKLNLFKRC